MAKPLIVVKIGGSIAGEASNLAKDIAHLASEFSFVIVHGGAKQTTELSERLGLQPKFITSPSGVKSRYTDSQAIDIYTLAMRGKVNASLVLALQREGVNAIGISGIDGRLLLAKQKIVTSIDENGKQKVIRDDFTGKIEKVNPQALERLLSDGFTPVVAPIALGESNQPLNTDGDRAAAAIAGALQAAKLLLMTDVDGYYKNFPNDLAPSLTRAEIEDSIRNASGGMKRKLMACGEATDSGVKEAIMARGTRERPVSEALAGGGTHIATTGSMRNEPQTKTKSNAELTELETRLEMNTYKKRDIAIVRGKGSIVWDVEGKEYVDFTSGIGVAVLGHAHPKLCGAIATQAHKIMTCNESFANDQRVELLERLAKLWSNATGRNGRIFFSNSGAEANEAALKLARAKTGRKGFIAAMNAFHGRTSGSLTLTFKPKYRERFEPLLGPITRVRLNDIEGLKAAVTQETAAVFLEVIQGEGGVRLAKEEYLKAARDICTDKGALLIFDEVQVGMGRTGKFFSFEHFNVRPDMATMAKGLAGGVPIGATIANEEDCAFKILEHGTTFGGNPLSCAAANATLAIYEEAKILEQVKSSGSWLFGQLAQLKQNHHSILDIRGMGLILGTEMKVEVTPLLKAAQSKGLLILSAGDTVIRLLPPLNTSREIYEKALPILDSVLP